jgi:predicted TIM-barrel fold metal-dependent hydrolase
MAGVIDFHTHAFPDELAPRAISALEAEAEGVRAFLDGRVSSLLSSMDSAGIEKSVVCSIATKPAQFEPILIWSKKIASRRIIPFPSFHPADPDPAERIRRIKGEGFKGVKFHPFYQDFFLDEPGMMKIYEEIAGSGLLMVMHTGYDIAFERIRRADPARILRVHQALPALRMVTTHLGAWEQWDEVRELLLGREIYMELSFSIEYLGEGARDFILGHPGGYVFFGTDSPWTGQKETLQRVKALGLGEKVEAALLRDNALRLLGPA